MSGNWRWRTINLNYILFLSIPFSVYAIPSAVTYTFDGAGRFGDCVLLYCKAKYFAVKCNMVLLYKPFSFSNELALHMHETYWTQDLENKFRYKKRVMSAQDIDPNESDTLYVVDLFTSFTDVAPRITHKQLEPVDHWINLFADEVYQMMQQDIAYKSIIKDMLKPIRTLALPDFPKCYISVAVHIRTGTGYDGNLWSKQLYSGFKRTTQKIVPVTYWIADCACPLRFPPIQYYIDQINNLSDLVNGYPLYVQVFTDDEYPEKIINAIKKNCSGALAITLGTSGIWQNRTVDDIYAMSMFDCLIKPCSFFSGISQLVGNHKLIIRPDDYCFDDQALYITDMMFILNDSYRVKTIKVAYEQLHDAFLKDSVCKVLLGVP
jgi:hypothetical protein